MKHLEVKIEGKEVHDLVFALEEVARVVEKEVTWGKDENDDGSYIFEITESDMNDIKGGE